MTREMAFLLAAVHRFFQPGSPLPLASGLNWPKVADLARRHAVVPLFSHAVQQANDIPETILANLQDEARTAAKVDLTLNAELARLLQLLEHHHIPVIAYKGPVLRATLYGDAALRSFTDLDLLVHPHHVVPAKRLLEDRGYQLDSTVHWSVEDACQCSRDSEISFSLPANGVRVDLHWRLLPDYFPQPFNDREVWLDLRRVPLAGALTTTLPPERLLLFLCAHGAKHLWDRLAWVCDVARLLQVEPLMNWTRVFDQARQTDTSRMLLLGLILASELLGVEPLSTAGEWTDPQARALAAIIRHRIDNELPRPSTMESARFSVHAFERMDHRVRFIYGLFVEPTEAEYLGLKLPPFLYWLYYFYRPVRLAAKYSRLWSRSPQSRRGHD